MTFSLLGKVRPGDHNFWKWTTQDYKTENILARYDLFCLENRLFSSLFGTPKNRQKYSENSEIVYEKTKTPRYKWNLMLSPFLTFLEHLLDAQASKNVILCFSRRAFFGTPSPVYMHRQGQIWRIGSDWMDLIGWIWLDGSDWMDLIGWIWLDGWIR